MLMFIPNMVSGKTLKFTCEYKPVFGKTDDERNIYTEIGVAVYDDGSYDLKYLVRNSKGACCDWGNSGGMILKSENGANGKFYSEFSNFKIYSEHFKLALDAGKKCPSLVKQTGLDGKTQFSFTSSSSDCKVGDNTCTKPIKDNELESKKYSFILQRGVFSTLPEKEVTLKLYEDETKQLCVQRRDSRNTICDNLNKNESYNNNDVALEVKIENTNDSIVINGSQIDKIFYKTNDKQLKYEDIFLIKISENPNRYELSTSSKTAMNVYGTYYDITDKKVYSWFYELSDSCNQKYKNTNFGFNIEEVNKEFNKENNSGLLGDDFFKKYGKAALYYCQGEGNVGYQVCNYIRNDIHSLITKIDSTCTLKGYEEPKTCPDKYYDDFQDKYNKFKIDVSTNVGEDKIIVPYEKWDDYLYLKDEVKYYNNNTSCDVKDEYEFLMGNFERENYFTCSGLKTIEWLQKLFDLIKIIGPILVVLFSAYDYLKSIFSSNDDALTKTNQRFIKRVIAAALIFLLPALLSIILNFVGDRFGADICGIK